MISGAPRTPDTGSPHGAGPRAGAIAAGAGIWFGHTEPLPARVKLAFRFDADAWNGVRRVRLLVEAAEL